MTILVRLLGAEEAAQAQTWTTPFTDVPDWAQSYVATLRQGYTTGWTHPVWFLHPRVHRPVPDPPSPGPGL